MRISDWVSAVCSSDLPAGEKFGAGHPQRRAGPLAEPSGEPDMIGMMVGGDHPRHPDRGEQRLPDIAADRRVEAGVDDRRPRSLRVMVVEQPEVDVVEAERERESVGEGKSGSVSVSLGGPRLIEKKKKK